ncbi:unnamed protein product, partial [Prorocentrum cordatum]
VDKTLRVFDLRNFAGPVQVLHGHQLAVRRVKCHPHAEHQLVSSSYDMSVNVWDMNMGQMIQHFDHHSEFVLGVDLSLFEDVASLWRPRLVGETSSPCPPPVTSARHARQSRACATARACAGLSDPTSVLTRNGASGLGERKGEEG